MNARWEWLRRSEQGRALLAAARDNRDAAVMRARTGTEKEWNWKSGLKL